MRTATLSRTGRYEGKSLHVRGLVFRTLRIEPDADLASAVTLDAAFEDQAEFDRIVIKEGRKVSLTCPSDGADMVGNGVVRRGGFLRNLLRRSVVEQGVTNVTLELVLRVPPGFPVFLCQGGSGDVEVGKVGGTMELDLSGSLDFTCDASGALTLDISGSASARISEVVGPMELDLSGSADLSIEAIDAEVLGAETSGSARLAVRSGRAGRLVLETSSSRETEIGADIVGDAEIEMSSVGDVTLRSVGGKVEHDLSGVGTLRVNGRRVGR